MCSSFIFSLTQLLLQNNHCCVAIGLLQVLQTCVLFCRMYCNFVINYWQLCRVHVETITLVQYFGNILRDLIIMHFVLIKSVLVVLTVPVFVYFCLPSLEINVSSQSMM